jgi:hypothetical protein
MPSDDGGTPTEAGAGNDGECNEPGPGEVFDGDVFLTTEEEAETARAYSEITGDLPIFGMAGLGADLPNLTRVGGDVRADSTEIERLSLVHLREIGGELWIYLNRSLLEIDLRNLVTVGEQVFIDRNDAVTAVQLFALEEIAGEPADGFVFTAQLALPSCFEERLLERYPNVSITPGNGPVCDDCSFECGALVVNCTNGPFRCGESLVCERSAQYCHAIIPGTPEVEPTYSCVGLPEECAFRASCACLGIDPLGMQLDDGGFMTCSESEGIVSVSVAYP